MEQRAMPCANHECPFHEVHAGTDSEPVDGYHCMVTDAVKQVTFDNEEALFTKGQPNGNLYALEDGVVKITCNSSDGSEQIVGISTEGSLLAGLQSFTDDCYEYSAVAATPVKACKISHRALMSRAEDQGRLAMRLIGAINAQLAHSRSLMRVLGHKCAAAKLASFLLLMVPRSRRSNRSTPLPFSRLEIANLIGLSEETVCRQMARMKREVIVHAPRGRIKILDWERLRRIADGTEKLNGRVVSPGDSNP